MYQVVVLPPPDGLAAVEELRRRHDPAFHRVGPHLPLLPPFEPGDPEFLRRFDSFRGRGFRAGFGAPCAVGEALCLPVADGGDEVAALRESLASALLPADACRPCGPASLRVGLFGNAAELELARRALAQSPVPPPFRVAAVVLLMEDVRGLWHEVRRRPLGG